MVHQQQRALAVGAEIKDNRDILPMPIVPRRKQLPSSSTTENNTHPFMFHSPSTRYSMSASKKSETPSSTVSIKKIRNSISSVHQKNQKLHLSVP